MAGYPQPDPAYNNLHGGGQGYAYNGDPHKPANPVNGYSPALPQPVYANAAPAYAATPSTPTRSTGSHVLVAWILFAVGFIFPITWIVALFLPCCLGRKGQRFTVGSFLPWLLSTIFLVLYIVLIIVIIVLVANGTIGGNGDGYYYSCYYYC